VTDVAFHPLAEQELVEAANFYEARAAGLGHDFIREVEHMLAQIVATPEAGTILSGTIRRRLVRRFPFAILYQAGAKNVSVIALMHLRRRPGYWRRRLWDNTETDL
jgi:toxin ParE1/3/4